ncbi:hypothetical protein CLOM_g5922 [Closterium sp. NIES-68]|nr:hypothetical protein CLOM_g5922 [Closterium sp. NIES-68]GJP63257.1 hypothetical protein CLOP_g20317 [Closterium sp. NIES-67]
MSNSGRASSDASSSHNSTSPESLRPPEFSRTGSPQNSNKKLSHDSTASTPSSSSSSSGNPPPRAKPRPSASSSFPPPSPADVASLREQWKYALRMYSVQYANAWGGVIAAGVCLYGLGWYIKGEDPLLDFRRQERREKGRRGEESGGGVDSAPTGGGG